MLSTKGHMTIIQKDQNDILFIYATTTNEYEVEVAKHDPPPVLITRESMQELLRNERLRLATIGLSAMKQSLAANEQLRLLENDGIQNN